MASYVLTLNESSIVAKKLLDYLKSLSKTSDCVDIVVCKKEESPYNQEFVKELIKSRNAKGVTIKREDLWK